MIKLALFDMDGTIVDSNLDWPSIRQHLQIKPGHSILSDIYAHDRVDEARLAILEAYEQENTVQVKPIKGIDIFLEYLASLSIKRALITNNNRANTDYILQKYQFFFDLVITREKRLWKPEPDVFYYVMEQFGCLPSETVSIGDSHYDIIASRAAQLAQIYIIAAQAEGSAVDPGIVYFSDYIHLKEIFGDYHSVA